METEMTEQSRMEAEITELVSFNKLWIKLITNSSATSSVICFTMYFMKESITPICVDFTIQFCLLKHIRLSMVEGKGKVVAVLN
jgi:hypothetical protein